MVDGQTQIEALVTAHPKLKPVLERLGIYPVPHSLEEECFRRDLDLEAVVTELMLVLNEPRASPELLSDQTLVAFIVTHHHQTLRASLSVVLPLMERVVELHLEQNPKLAVVRQELGTLAAGLLGHMEEEELVLFPLFISRRCRSPEENRELALLHREHQEVEVALGRIRAATDGYVPPDWASQDYRVLLRELKLLDRELRDHVRLEDSVMLRLTADA